MEANVSNPRGTVLVVEDEPFVRLMAADVLARAGFDVLEAGNADEALHILETRADVRLIFTDVDMPGSIDGLGLAESIDKRWPRIGVVFTSGHRRHMARIPAGSCFLAKPYAATDLVRQIEEAMFAAAPAMVYSSRIAAHI
ncbi:MAG: response regulator [Beijerinckiaceae bacterium]|nr:response regulator [Beijerinckiaceae bacterium]